MYNLRIVSCYFITHSHVPLKKLWLHIDSGQKPNLNILLHPQRC